MGYKEDTLRENFLRVQERIHAATARAGRRAEDITVVAVTKTFPAEAIRAAHELGLCHFGENRVQEWEGKRAQLTGLDATWHLVGLLQSNKARRAVEIFHRIDSVDSVALAERLNRLVTECSGGLQTGQSKLPILLEVRLAPEESKTGFEPAELRAAVEKIVALEHLVLRGLMCVPPYIEDPQQVRPYFRRLREIRDDLQHRFSSSLHPPPSILCLSMGMSHDFEVAIEEGATEIRLGTALFGERSGK